MENQRIEQMKVLVQQLEELGQEELKADVAALKDKIIAFEEKAKEELVTEEKIVLTWAERFRKSQGLSVEMFILQIVVFATILMKALKIL